MEHGKFLLGQYPPSGDVARLVAAIEECQAFKLVEGSALISGNAGVVLHAPSSAQQVLYRAERANSSAAASWFIRPLTRQETDGMFIAALRGISISQPVKPTETTSLIPFDSLADCGMKRRILNAAREMDDYIGFHSTISGAPVQLWLRRSAVFPLSARSMNRFQYGSNCPTT